VSPDYYPFWNLHPAEPVPAHRFAARSGRPCHDWLHYFRGGLQAIDRGQYEAAQALGLSGTLTITLIILPQALQAVIPALFNSFISLFKDTSLAAIIGLFEVLRIARSILVQSEWLGTHREVFLFAFLIYWAFNLAFTYGSHRVEAALGVGKR